jgi:hypothetical protein
MSRPGRDPVSLHALSHASHLLGLPIVGAVEELHAIPIYVKVCGSGRV